MQFKLILSIVHKINLPILTLLYNSFYYQGIVQIHRKDLLGLFIFKTFKLLHNFQVAPSSLLFLQ